MYFDILWLVLEYNNVRHLNYENIWTPNGIKNILGRLDFQLSVQSVPITTDVVSSNLDQGEVYKIMW